MDQQRGRRPFPVDERRSGEDRRGGERRDPKRRGERGVLTTRTGGERRRGERREQDQSATDQDT